MYLYNGQPYESLPERIRLPDGSTRTSLNELSSEQLIDLGVIEYQDLTPTFDQYLYEYSGAYEFNHNNRTFIRLVVPKSTDALKQNLINAIQSYLDTEAQVHFYDGILSLCSYATSSNPKFGPEGQAGVVWRDACWTKGYQILAEVEAETRPIPTVEELMAEMPTMIWP